MSIPEGSQHKLNDYTSEVSTLLPTYLLQAQNDTELSSALSGMLNLEKRTRLAADTVNSLKITKALLEILYTRQKWNLLNEYILILCKRRAQLQKVYENIVQQAYTYVDTTTDAETKRQLIITLRTVTAGKIFVELERARLTKILAEMEEKDGNIIKASELMQDITVETIGTMEISEKAEFLLEQMRLCLELKDFIRTELIAKKVDKKALNDMKLEELKIRFYRLQIVYYLHFGNYFEISKAWREIYYTPKIQKDQSAWREALSQLVLFALLSSYDSESADVLNRIQVDKRVKYIPELQDLLEECLCEELIQWPLKQEASIRAYSIFQSGASEKMDVSDPASTAKASKSALIVHNAAQRWSDLHKRIVQHNIRVIASFYARISTDRLAELLNLTVQQAEDYISELVSSKQLFARIDRPIGRIVFKEEENTIEAMNAFRTDVESLLSLVDTTTHLINKELMIHRVR